MAKFKIGVALWSFNIDVKSSLKKAEEIGFDGVQLMCLDELDPRNLSKTARDDLLKLTVSSGLPICSLCAEQGGFTSGDISEKVKMTKMTLDLCSDLKTSIVTAHIGRIPEDSKAKEWGELSGVLKDIGKYAEKVGACFASETGPESSEVMRKFFEETGSPALKVNYDPANLLSRGFDPVKGVDILKDYIVQVHVKDARRGEGEKAMGDGNVPFKEWLEALKNIKYDGFYTIEREKGDTREEDIRKAKTFLTGVVF